MALGTVGQLEQVISQALARPVEAAQAYVRQQAAKNVDETGWKEKGRRAWLWTVVTTWVSVFVIRFSRGSKGIRELLGEDVPGVVGSDRYSAYSFLPLSHRQVCWAHLRRDFQKRIDRGGESGEIGEILLALTDQMFAWWHRVRDGTRQRRSFQTYMVDHKARMPLYLWWGTKCAQENQPTPARKFSASSRPCGRLCIDKEWNRPTTRRNGRCAMACCGAKAVSVPTAKRGVGLRSA